MLMIKRGGEGQTREEKEKREDKEEEEQEKVNKMMYSLAFLFWKMSKKVR